MGYNIAMFGRLSYLISNPIELVYMIIPLLLSMTLHEWGHAFVAYRCGDPTARNFGRLTLNPLAHIDIFGFLCLLIVGFGWAKPVPIVPRNFKNPRRDEIRVSLAGVTMNLILLLITILILVITIRSGSPLLANEAFMSIMTYMLSYNTVLMVFNLIPLPPLDGSHILELALARRVSLTFILNYKRYGRYILLALLITGALNVPLSWVLEKVWQLIILLCAI